MKIVIATIKSWNIERAIALKNKYEGIHEIIIYTRKEELTYEGLCEAAPDYVLFPHWSYIIPKSITDNFECVVFHMTDLPYGRGGSPLQNLIVRGHKDTKISAIKVTEQIDAGPVYMKKPLSLEGAAHEIFVRCSETIFSEMIPEFLGGKIVAEPQTGEPVIFRRRKPEDGKITSDMDIEKIYDYIRMLDAEGYPRAYIDFGDYRLEFEDAAKSADGNELRARVTFKKITRVN